MTHGFIMRFVLGIFLLAPLTVTTAAEPGDVDAVAKAVLARLAHHTIDVQGTVTMTSDGKPLTTTTFTARFKRPRWMITWEDSGIGTFKPSGEVWGNGTQSHLRFTGQQGIETSTDSEMTIAASTGISHSLTYWLYDLYRGKTDTLIPSTGTVTTHDKTTQIAGTLRPGNDRVITITDGLITGIEEINDLSKAQPEQIPEFTDEQIIKVLKVTGKEPTPELIAETRQSFVDAQKSLAAAKNVFHSTYTLTWTFDRPHEDQELVPEQSNPDVK